MKPEDISEGLRIALSKGESLQNAMQSFYNAGYSRDEIESAARMINNFQMNSQKSQPMQIENKEQGMKKQTHQVNQQNPPKLKQNVSDYNENSKDPRKAMVTLVIVMLIIFGIVLAGLFFFKESVISFLEGLVA